MATLAVKLHKYAAFVWRSSHAMTPHYFFSFKQGSKADLVVYDVHDFCLNILSVCGIWDSVELKIGSAGVLLQTIQIHLQAVDLLF